MTRVFLLLGSNLGDAHSQLRKAREAIQSLSSHPIKASSVFATQAWGKTNQPDFLNQAVEILFNDSPQLLLSKLLEIEQGMGRIRNEKWGPRLIDIDILFFGNERVSQTDLKIPHPEIQNRRFVLVPLNELASAFIHPILKKSVRQLLDECQDTLEVRLLKD